MVLAQNISVPQFPEKSGVIRVKQYKQSLAIESDGKKGSRGKAWGAAQQCHLSGGSVGTKAYLGNVTRGLANQVAVRSAGGNVSSRLVHIPG